MWDVNITNKPIIAVCVSEEDWSGLVVGIFTGEDTMKVLPVNPDEEYYRWSLLIKVARYSFSGSIPPKFEIKRRFRRPLSLKIIDIS